MKKYVFFIALFLLCQISVKANSKLDSLFPNHKGLIFLYDEKLGETFTNNTERAKEPYPPCSTFKIPNSMIALDLGVIKNPKSKVKWDAKKYPRKKSWAPSWAQDHNLETAFQESVLWFYQELAKKIGFENYQNYLEKFDYGNVALTGDVDEFWIHGSLRITAREQVTFLQNFYRENFDIQKKSYEVVKDILVLEKNNDWTLSGKTGTCVLDNNQKLGWLVGYFEKQDQVIYYALQMDGKDYAEISKQKRIALVKKALALQGYLSSF